MCDHLRVSQLVADLLSRGGATILGLFLVVSATISLLRTVVIPRALRSFIADTVARAVTGTFLVISRLRRDYPKRDSILAWAGPTTILAQLITWLALYLIGYGLLIFGVGGLDVGSSVRQAGSSLFTLGFAAVDTESQTAIDFIAAATGPIVIALMIGFLPTIYSSYLDREVEVTMLGVNGGEPAWGVELLCRESVAGSLHELDTLFDRWSRWAATLRMSHVTYPVLIWVRSSRYPRHYVTALLAMLDGAALRIALTRSGQHRAYALLLQGSQAMQVLYIHLFGRRPWRPALPFIGRFSGGPEQVAESVGRKERHAIATEIAASQDAAQGQDRTAMAALSRGAQQPSTVSRKEFDDAVDLLRRAGFPIEVEPDLAWTAFRAIRCRYEFAALAIAERLDAPPSPWSGSRRVPTPVTYPTLVVDVLPQTRHDAPEQGAPGPDGSEP